MAGSELTKIAEEAFYTSKARTYAGSAAKAGAIAGLLTGIVAKKGIRAKDLKPILSTGVAYGLIGGMAGGLVDRNPNVEGGNNYNV